MKKVLIITYYWPPAGGAGVQRALKFVKYLPQFGWQPIVLTVQNPDSPVDDKTLLNDIPPECKVYKTKSVEPFDLYKILTGKKKSQKIPSDVIANSKNLSFPEKVLRWIRINLFVPDAKIGWKYYAVRKAEEIIKKENIDLLFSTSPPHTVALIAKKIARKSKLKWIADFRDPWLEIVYYQSVKRNVLTKIIDSKLEKGVLNAADVIVTITNDMVKLFKTKVGEKNYQIIPNGFDESDFQEIQNKNKEYFQIAYTGVITKSRVPLSFLNALNKMIYMDKIKNIKFVVAGKSCLEFKEAIKKYQLENYVDEKGYLPHHESTKILQTSDNLLLVIDNLPNNKGVLTGKIFEYLGAKIPIYAIGPIDGDANIIIKSTDSGIMIEHGDDNSAYELLIKMYRNWKENKNEFSFKVEQYSRKYLTKKLTEIFNKQY